MCTCGVRTKTKTIYHDGRDWIIEKRGDEYWSFSVDEEEWIQGLPAGITIEDAALLF
jgi:hypothetical protein